IMGADSWTEITTWREWQRLLTMCDHIVVTRPGYDLPSEASRGSVVDIRGRDQSAIHAIVDGSVSPNVFLTDAVLEDVSATGIRAAARNGKQDQLVEMVPLEVANYIEKYQLYRN